MSDQDGNKSASRYLSHGKGGIIYDEKRGTQNLYILKPKPLCKQIIALHEINPIFKENGFWNIFTYNCIQIYFWRLKLSGCFFAVSYGSLGFVNYGKEGDG